MTQVDLSIVIINWNVRDLLVQCLRSLFHALEGADLRVEYIVVDNASHDDSVATVQRLFPDVHVVALPENRGYTGGVNAGLQVAQGRFILVLNPDTEALDDAPQRLVHFLETHPRVGCVGPALFYPDGARQPSRRRFHSLPVLFFQDTPLHRFITPWLKRFFVADRSDEDAQPVEWLVGAALCVRRDVLADVGGMDERYFMYFEEVDWQRRMRDAGWEIWYLPEARFIHHEGASSGQVVAARHLRYARSRILYTERWHGRVWAWLLRRWLRLFFMWELALEWAKLQLRHKPDMRRARVQAYRQVLAEL